MKLRKTSVTNGIGEKEKKTTQFPTHEINPQKQEAKRNPAGRQRRNSFRKTTTIVLEKTILHLQAEESHPETNTDVKIKQIRYV